MAAAPGFTDEVRADREARYQSWFAEGWYGGQTAPEAMAEGLLRHPEVELVLHADGHLTRATLREVHERGVRVAAGLASLGLRSGDTVAIQVPNWLEGIVTLYGAMRLGLVVVPLVHIYGPTEVSFILRQSRARALVVPDRWRSIDYTARVAALTEVPSLEHVVVLGDEVPAGAVSWHELVERADPEAAPPPDRSADDVCLLVYTSGTTAEPKGVLHTHNTFLSEVRAMPAILGRTEGTVQLSAFPAGHIAGVLGVARPFVHGTSSVIMDTWDPAAAAALIEEFGVTATAGTPFHLTTLLDAAEGAGRDLSTLGDFMLGAASVPPAVIERAQAAGIAAYRCYGSTEHPTITSSVASDPIAKRAGTDGRPIGANRVRLVDDDGHDVPPGTPGEVVSIGPEQCLGYTDPALNRDAFLPGGWFRTGDIGVLDGDGFLTITDRKKDIIIRGGENLSSKEIEDVLARHPAVAEAAVVGMPDPLYGERACAFVILAPGAAPIGLEEVRAHFVTAGVAKQKTPERVEVVAELPRTPAGKVKKFELRKRLG